jgi:hypothetical protein
MLCPQKNLSSSKKKKEDESFLVLPRNTHTTKHLLKTIANVKQKKKRRGERRRSTDTDGGIVDSNFIPNLSFSGRKPAAP